ncbi:putative quinol monooxygenase [Roseomonas elaeocarpi]|uniref:Quinol monooxygenase n=1 Tax=Roseomonas elaeocarpi TaxID=907779 RepID=A0ABV6JP09_9PROT
MPASAYVVIAEFRLKPEGRDRFLALARDDARLSVRDEPGCQGFELLLSEEDPNLAVLHEVYDNRAAFEAHLQAPHYAPFRDGTPALIEGKTVRFFGRDAG